MSAVAGWLGPGIGVALVVALQPALVAPIVVTGAALGCLPLLLITTLALVAIYSPDQDRRAAAAAILNQLLTALRPHKTSTHPPKPRRRSRNQERHPGHQPLRHHDPTKRA
ncbi:MAG: hypothetical protein ACRDS0_04665 [Pseudonocardiaceae bacterium]